MNYNNVLFCTRNQAGVTQLKYCVAIGWRSVLFCLQYFIVGFYLLFRIFFVFFGQFVDYGVLS